MSAHARGAFPGSPKYHSILSHEYNTLNLGFSSQALPDLVHLLRADIVDLDDEDGVILF